MGQLVPTSPLPPQLQIILRRTKPNTNCLRGEGGRGQGWWNGGGGGRDERAGVAEWGGGGMCGLEMMINVRGGRRGREEGTIGTMLMSELEGYKTCNDNCKYSQYIMLGSVLFL
jgi:hypothetical protein